MPITKNFAIGAALAGLAVLFGAFGAHAFKSIFQLNEAAIFETAVRYQMYHGLGIMLLAIATSSLKIDFSKAIKILIAGTAVFSGSLYLLVFSGVKFWGAITPIGGTLMIIGWGLVTYTALKK